MMPAAGVTAIRGALVRFSGDPFIEGVAATRHHEPDAIVAMANGRIVDRGAARVRRALNVPS
jgi:guanine deaminase